MAISILALMMNHTYYDYIELKLNLVYYISAKMSYKEALDKAIDDICNNWYPFLLKKATVPN
jgi:hypothetical protein